MASAVIIDGCFYPKGAKGVATSVRLGIAMTEKLAKKALSVKLAELKDAGYQWFVIESLPLNTVSEPITYIEMLDLNLKAIEKAPARPVARPKKAKAA